ncbi:MAG: GLPGLI family protein [Chitinophagaceae bacterium]
MKLLLATSLFFSFLFLNAQTHFLNEGRVEYEKKVNQFKSLEEDEEEGDWIKELKKTMPRFVSDIYELHFTQNKSVYHLKAENADNKYLWGTKPSETDITIQDFENNKLSIQRDVYEQTYLINDSIRKFEWKITGEIREIAGFECKKAVTKICDSVYIVAFYTDKIMCNGGPESFGGLPGLILGLAVPRLATTWFATKVESTTLTQKQLSPIQKGKKVNWLQVNADMKKAMKDWGKYGARRIWMYSL